MINCHLTHGFKSLLSLLKLIEELFWDDLLPNILFLRLLSKLEHSARFYIVFTCFILQVLLLLETLFLVLNHLFDANRLIVFIGSYTT